MFSRDTFLRMSLRKKKKKEKDYDPMDATVKIVDRKDDLDPMSESTSPRGELPCGHAVTPESLTNWCRSQLDGGIYKFVCAAMTAEYKRCNHPLSYEEVRKMASLSLSEMEHFETTIARLAAADFCETQECPQCKTMMERKDPSNLCVICTVCRGDRRLRYQFCWQCGGAWKGRAPRSDRCDNKGCFNNLLELLRTCRTISLPEVRGVKSCPSVRLCPTCGMKVEHNRQHCKNITCPRCQVPFCFVCLELKRTCSQTSSPYEKCPGGVAPRQTSIPVWHKE